MTIRKTTLSSECQASPKTALEVLPTTQASLTSLAIAERTGLQLATDTTTTKHSDEAFPLTSGTLHSQSYPVVPTLTEISLQTIAAISGLQLRLFRPLKQADSLPPWKDPSIGALYAFKRSASNLAIVGGDMRKSTKHSSNVNWADHSNFQPVPRMITVMVNQQHVPLRAH